jgi:sugar/nucleoside kinase (ribokinase family)
MAARPDLIIIGQVTIDDVVPALPGPWQRQMGGSSLYAVAGARLWLDPARIGLLARTGRDYPFDAHRVLRNAGLQHIALAGFPREHLIEWLIYEPDGSRRSLPRNPGALASGAEGSTSIAPYDHLLADIAPGAELLPPHWLPTAAVHLCPQIGSKHHDSLQYLRDKSDWISVDPSPHYSRAMSVSQLRHFLDGATALLPSAQEVGELLKSIEPAVLAQQLQGAGFAEVVIKRGDLPLVFAHAGSVETMPIRKTEVVDPTGAGDSFCGAYAACRLLGHSPMQSVRRAAATAALVVTCSGVQAALELATPSLI